MDQPSPNESLPSKKAKIATEQRAEVAKRKRDDRQALKEAWRKILRDSTADLTPPPKGPETETHSSHTLIACGGWVGVRSMRRHVQRWTERIAAENMSQMDAPEHPARHCKAGGRHDAAYARAWEIARWVGGPDRAAMDP